MAEMMHARTLRYTRVRRGSPSFTSTNYTLIPRTYHPVPPSAISIIRRLDGASSTAVGPCLLYNSTTSTGPNHSCCATLDGMVPCLVQKQHDWCDHLVSIWRDQERPECLQHKGTVRLVLLRRLPRLFRSPTLGAEEYRYHHFGSMIWCMMIIVVVLSL